MKRKKSEKPFMRSRLQKEMGHMESSFGQYLVLLPLTSRQMEMGVKIKLKEEAIMTWASDDHSDFSICSIV